MKTDIVSYVLILVLILILNSKRIMELVSGYLFYIYHLSIVSDTMDLLDRIPIH